MKQKEFQNSYQLSKDFSSSYRKFENKYWDSKKFEWDSNPEVLENQPKKISWNNEKKRFE